MSVFARVLAAFRGVGVTPLAHDAAPEAMTIRIAAAKQPVHPANGRASSLRANRLHQIAGFYAAPTNTLHIKLADCAFLPPARRQAARDLLAKLAGLPIEDRPGAPAQTAEAALRQTILTRPVADLNHRERATLRLAELLRELGEIDRATELQLRLPIVWNKGGGRAETAGFDSLSRRSALKATIETLLVENDAEPADGPAWLQRAWRNALSLDSALGADERRFLESYQFIDRPWLAAPVETATAPSSAALRLGRFEGSRHDLVYDRAAALITIAPPGSRPRDNLVLHNLMQLTAGAVVLDIDGRAFRETAQWRQERVGKVFAFAPALPAHSAHYNPLDAIPAVQLAGWAAAQQLADLLIEPTGDSDADAQARGLIAPAILDVVLNEPAGGRTIGAVLARIFCSGDQFERWCDGLRQSHHATLQQHGARLRALPGRERAALLHRIGPQLEIWRVPTIAALTDRSGCTAHELRRRKATLYLCVNRGDLARFAPLIRTIIGQTMAALGRDQTISPGATVTFFLDGVARLGPIGIVEQMTHGGAECGVRPWLFFADDADMRAAYPDAGAMIANCGAQCYIDPDPATARELSLRLGHCKSLFGTDRKPLADRTALTGPAFAGRIIALVRGLPPARLLSLDAAPDQPPPQLTRH